MRRSAARRWPDRTTSRNVSRSDADRIPLRPLDVRPVHRDELPKERRLDLRVLVRQRRRHAGSSSSTHAHAAGQQVVHQARLEQSELALSIQDGQSLVSVLTGSQQSPLLCNGGTGNRTDRSVSARMAACPALSVLSRRKMCRSTNRCSSPATHKHGQDMALATVNVQTCLRRTASSRHAGGGARRGKVQVDP